MSVMAGLRSEGLDVSCPCPLAFLVPLIFMCLELIEVFLVVTMYVYLWSLLKHSDFIDICVFGLHGSVQKHENVDENLNACMCGSFCSVRAKVTEIPISTESEWIAISSVSQ